MLLEAPPPALVEAMLGRCLALLGAAGEAHNVHAVCNVSWALAVFGGLTPARFAALLDLTPRDAPRLDALPKRAWCQIFQCALYLEVRRPGVPLDVPLVVPLLG